MSDPVQEIIDAGGMVTDGPLPLDVYGWGVFNFGKAHYFAPGGEWRVALCGVECRAQWPGGPFAGKPTIQRARNWTRCKRCARKAPKEPEAMRQ